MAKFLRGALVEYSGAFLGPIPNVVVFQFNPEQLARTITIPPVRSAADQKTDRLATPTGQTAAPPTETFTITAHFSAADNLGDGGAVAVLPRLFGVGPQLAALEKMVYPPSQPGGILGAALDAIGDLLGGGGNEPATRKVPPERVPRLLFIWGATRVLPVRVQSMTITEQKFDALLNPVQAQVQIGLAVVSLPPKDDDIATGALAYSQAAKDVQAVANLAKAVEAVVELIPI